MKLIKHIENLNVKEILFLWKSVYSSDETINLNVLQQFLKELKSKDLKETDAKLVVGKINKEDIPEELGNSPYMSCTMKRPEDDEYYAITFVPWGEVLNMEVEFYELSEVEAITCILYDLSFDGYNEESMNAAYEELCEAIERSEKDDALFYTLDEVMATLEDDYIEGTIKPRTLKEIEGSKEKEEEKEEEK